MSRALAEFEAEPALIDEYGDWTECAAFRFVREGDTVRLQVAKSLEEITSPAAEGSRA